MFIFYFIFVYNICHIFPVCLFTLAFSFVIFSVQGKINNINFEKLKREAVGESVTLTCEAFGNPQPNVTWMHENGTNFRNNVIPLEKEIGSEPFCCDVTRKLQFTQLTKENNGTYTCSVTVDGMVTDSENVDLIVIGE